ncbi:MULTISPECIES: GAF domain-containing protein [Actinomycetes]|uniref:GAF domain-containing protein n=1 Tax=Actinomycetes TaxID=1760 RepID=UPI0035CB7BCB
MTDTSPATAVERAGSPATPATPLVGQAAGADERLVDELDRSVRRRRVQRLLRAHKLLAAELSLPSLYRQVAAVGGRLVDRSASSLVVLNADGEVVQLLEWGASTGEATTTELQPADAGQLTRLVSRLWPELVRRLSPRERVAPEVGAAWLPGDLAVPVTYRGTLLAVLNVHQESSRSFSVADRDILASFGLTAGIAIENARLYEESRQREVWLEHAATLSTGLLGSAGQGTAVALVAEGVQRLADADHVALWTSSSPDDVSTASAAGWEGTLPLPSTADVLARQALEQRRGVRTLAGDHPRSPLGVAAVGLGAGPLMAFPFGAEGGQSGLMVVLRRSGRPAFSGFELDRAIEFTTQLALAVEVLSARTLHHQLLLVTERERLATNLRDDVVQDLYAAGLKASSLAADMPNGESRSRLNEVVAILHDCVIQLRRSIFRLKQPGFEVAADDDDSREGREGVEPPTR